MNEMKKQLVLTTELLVLFSELGLQELNISGLTSDVDLGLAIKLLTTETKQKIQFLKVTGAIEHVPLSTMMQLPSTLPNLITIIMPYTACNDILLAAIAKNCLHLTYLDVTKCPVTDRGLKHLHMENPQSSNIHTLGLLGTKITAKGIAEALLNLPHLQRIRCAHLAEALWSLYQLHPDTLLLLETLFLEIKMESLTFATHQATDSLNLLSAPSRNCPLTRCLTLLTDIGIPQQSFSPLKELKFLSCLCFFGTSPHHQQFLEIEPILQFIGMQLEEITLVNINGLDVHVLGSNCTRLKRLLLHNIYETVNEHIPIFSNLEFLQLGNVPVTLIQNVLMSHSNYLKKLQLYNCPNVGKEVWLTTEWPNLEHFSINKYPHLSLFDLFILIKNPDCPLKEINIDKCLLLKTKISELKLFVQTNNLQIHLTEHDISHVFGESKKNHLSEAFQ